jgi:hypothetical protein
MPTRLLREGILNSDRVNLLSAEEEVFYRRLMSKVDDHGLFDARPSMLRSSLYPLRIESTTENNCEQWLTACINAKLVIVYQSHGKPFLKMLDTKWKARSEPKFDPPVNGCKQLKAPVSLDVVVDVVRSRSRLIEVVDVDVDVGVGAPVDKSASNAKPAETRKPFEEVLQGKTYTQWIEELGITIQKNWTAPEVKLEVEKALEARHAH